MAAAPAAAPNQTDYGLVHLTIASPAPLLIQAANLLFLGAALFADVLLIRMCLSGAFLCLIAATAQDAAAHHSLMLDALIWLSVTGFLHWRAAWTLVKEELPRPPLADDDDKALFCYLHRRSGMGRKDFDRIRAIGSWQRFASGERICDTEVARRRLHLLLDGRVTLNLRYEGSSDESANGLRLNVGSGECFDLRLLNVCGVFIGFPNEDFMASATTECVCFTIPFDALERLVRENEHLLAFLRTYALALLARLAQRHPLVLDAFGQVEEAAWWSGARSRDFEPLRQREIESMQWSVASTFAWLRRSLKPSVQSGMRHASNPLSGSLAQASVRSKSAAGLTDLLRPTKEEVPLIPSIELETI